MIAKNDQDGTIFIPFPNTGTAAESTESTENGAKANTFYRRT
jgi:hypothetical protein